MCMPISGNVFYRDKSTFVSDVASDFFVKLEYRNLQLFYQ
jgi:hypothetical protein